MHPPSPRLVVLLTAALTLGLTACSVEESGSASPTAGTPDDTADGSTDPAAGTAADDPDADATSDPQGGFPVTVDSDSGEVTIQARPERIVSLSPSATEILFAIGAGDQVIAADQFSTYPAEAPTTDLSGFDPNVEAIVAYEPDLVVIATDANDLVASLGELDIPVLAQEAPVDVEAGYDLVAGLGQATGQVDGTAELVATMRAEMEEALASAADAEGVRVYHELDDTFFSASSASFIGSIYSALGAVNVADEADTEGTGYPQLTEEAVIEANPQLIVVTDQGASTAEDVAARPGWDAVDAVRTGSIVSVDADIASRWGPRLPQLVTSLAEAITEAAVPAGR
ncbi:ABC transporter substrate-binding protein [Ornithinimicrobium cerasi]|uniref:Iron complex transport system substrate-binding protein n=1 Tax=Ornithinimicrobium cerasi TaxID=2248773 RepID=A0A285VVG8_9MICO|nr:ABC transporter substrate-binding protein [Ornithinimicrobium cerasi]SOC57887.1 iron complex transport system substrate-binding protein [Ornithinimicrobium cerasi]